MSFLSSLALPYFKKQMHFINFLTAGGEHGVVSLNKPKEIYVQR
jgi:hypothetical protein